MTTTETPLRPSLDSRKRAALIAAAGVLILAVLFWDAFGNLWKRWGEQQELSHSYFIPFISAWLVWTNRSAVVASVGAPSFGGVVLFAIAGVLLLLGQVTHIFLLQHIGLVVAIAGLIAAFGGFSLLRATAAPVAFLLFAVPPPYWVITILSWKFQEMSSVIGVEMIKMMNIPVYLSGNIIDLGEYKLQVAEACSGLRYLFPFLSLGVMTAYLYRGPAAHKALIVLSTIPITILMNSFRIGVTGALVQAYGTEHAEGALHFFEGWVVFLMCLAALFAIVAFLAYLQKPKRKPLEAIGAPDLKAVPPSRKGPAPLVMLGAVAAAAAGIFGVSQLVSVETLVIPERETFAAVPGEFPGYASQVLPMDPAVAEVLGADDTIVVNLASPNGDIVNLYMAYLEAQRDGRSWHSPRQCIPGGGWRINSHEIINQRTEDGAPFNYNRLLIQNRDQRQLVYYWYDQRGRNVANEFVMKFWLIWDAVLKKRSDGALVRVITPVADGESIEAAEARLQMMMRRVDRFLPKYVPA